MFTKLLLMKAPARGSKPASPSKASQPPASPSRTAVPLVLDLERYLQTRDFAAALTLLRVQQQQHQEEQQQQKPKISNTPGSPTRQQQQPEVRFWRRNTWWKAYCDFQRGDIHGALAGFEALLQGENGDDAGTTNAQYEDPFVARDRIAWQISRACCLFYLQDFDGAEQQAMRVPRDVLCNRLLYLLAHEKTRGLPSEDKVNGEASAESAILLDRYSRLATHSSVRDQLAVAHSSFTQRNFSEAVDIYKQLLATRLKTENASAAVQVYLALCYFQLEYYDVAAELLTAYLESHPSSFFAVNIKACCHFRLYGADASLSVLDDFVARFPHHPTSSLADSSNIIDRNSSTLPVLDVATHNRAIFRESLVDTTSHSRPVDMSSPSIEVTLKQLLDVVPEARTNLALYLSRNRSLSYAMKLLYELEPASDSEKMAKSAVLALTGEHSDVKENVFLAEKLFNSVGTSAESVDTIPGRQCMASYFFLRREYADALVYLESIATYLAPNNSAFNWNYGLCLAIVASSSSPTESATIRHFQQAQESLDRARQLSKSLANDKILISWLARCYIRGDHSRKQNGPHIRAWELYLEFKHSNPAESEEVLKVVANDLYRAGRFFLAVKAFDILERLQDPVDPEIWEAKRGACVGFFKQVATGEEQDFAGVDVAAGKTSLVPLSLAARVDEVLGLLAHSKNALEASKLSAMLKKWVMTLKLR